MFKQFYEHLGLCYVRVNPNPKPVFNFHLLNSSHEHNIWPGLPKLNFPLTNNHHFVAQYWFLLWFQTFMCVDGSWWCLLYSQTQNQKGQYSSRLVPVWQLVNCSFFRAEVAESNHCGKYIWLDLTGSVLRPNLHARRQLKDHCSRTKSAHLGEIHKEAQFWSILPVINNLMLH